MSEKCQQSKSTSGEHYFVCHNHGLACHWCGQTEDIEPTYTKAEVNQLIEAIASLVYMKQGQHLRRDDCERHDLNPDTKCKICDTFDEVLEAIRSTKI